MTVDTINRELIIKSNEQLDQNNPLRDTLHIPEMEFKEFEPRFKSAKTWFKFSAGLNLKTFDTILSRTNHI